MITVHSLLKHLLEWMDPSRHQVRPALRMVTCLGAIGGFLLAYQRSSCERILDGYL